MVLLIQHQTAACAGRENLIAFSRPFSNFCCIFPGVAFRFLQIASGYQRGAATDKLVRHNDFNTVVLQYRHQVLTHLRLVIVNEAPREKDDFFFARSLLLAFEPAYKTGRSIRRHRSFIGNADLLHRRPGNRVVHTYIRQRRPKGNGIDHFSHIFTVRKHMVPHALGILLIVRGLSQHVQRRNRHAGRTG